MPTYEYRCSACDKEYSFKMPYKELRTYVPQCECGTTLERVVSLANVVKEISKPVKIGQATENSITEFKEDLKTQKKELKDKNK